jgi:hypothetical protein
MKDKDREHWMELCRAAIEQDPKKLLLLVTEINRLLAEKQGWVGRIQESKDRKQGLLQSAVPCLSQFVSSLTLQHAVLLRPGTRVQ